MRYRQLGKTGLRLSIISLGGSGYGNVDYGDLNETEAKRSLKYVMISVMWIHSIDQSTPTIYPFITCMCFQN